MCTDRFVAEHLGTGTLRTHTCNVEVCWQSFRHDAGVGQEARRSGALRRQLVLLEELRQPVQDEEQPKHLVQALQDVQDEGGQSKWTCCPRTAGLQGPMNTAAGGNTSGEQPNCSAYRNLKATCVRMCHHMWLLISDSRRPAGFCSSRSGVGSSVASAAARQNARLQKLATPAVTAAACSYNSASSSTGPWRLWSARQRLG